ncbi:AraC family transcriptional regulator [Pokkaliibacter plantistimulans]|uniref:AraC family transcriptional regulator n=1 Tax=Proteobacteria bacterium 228 TaxID=2083153 RepID=A0A2S5KWV0_9PROT|nr:helix-turn-helix domain-containing protein [Pokkaliibacter plantistimulans]PPC79250.1 AraC family transcriptional regulator [Pokkaliibacter plantistimulans]
MSSSVVYRVAGIHSKQPWFVMSAAEYFSLFASDDPMISHYYSFEADHTHGMTMAIPDGCVDIVFDCDPSAPNAVVCGTAVEATSARFIHKHRYFGVRYAPGLVPDFVKASAAEMIDQKLNFLDAVPGAHSLFEQIVSEQDFARQVTLLKEFVAKRSTRKQSAVTSLAVRTILQQKGNLQMRDLEEVTGFTSRTVQRQFQDDLGLSPKAFSRMIRGQSAVYEINHSRHNKVAFSELACDLGFSDQSHFLREFKKLVNATPLDYQNLVKQQTYLDRIRCC